MSTKTPNILQICFPMRLLIGYLDESERSCHHGMRATYSSKEPSHVSFQACKASDPPESAPYHLLSSKEQCNISILLLSIVQIWSNEVEGSRAPHAAIAGPGMYIVSPTNGQPIRESCARICANKPQNFIRRLCKSKPVKEHSRGRLRNSETS